MKSDLELDLPTGRVYDPTCPYLKLLACRPLLQLTSKTLTTGTGDCLEEMPRTDSHNQRRIGQVKLRYNRPTRALGGLWGYQGKTPVAFLLVKVLSYVSQPSLALCVP